MISLVIHVAGSTPDFRANQKMTVVELWRIHCVTFRLQLTNNEDIMRSLVLETESKGTDYRTLILSYLRAKNLEQCVTK